MYIFLKETFLLNCSYKIMMELIYIAVLQYILKGYDYSPILFCFNKNNCYINNCHMLSLNLSTFLVGVKPRVCTIPKHSQFQCESK